MPGGGRGRDWTPDRLSADLRHAEDRLVPAWLRPTGAENRIPAALAILAAIGLQLTVPDKYGMAPRYLLPSLDVTTTDVVDGVVS